MKNMVIAFPAASGSMMIVTASSMARIRTASQLASHMRASVLTASTTIATGWSILPIPTACCSRAGPTSARTVSLLWRFLRPQPLRKWRSGLRRERLRLRRCRLPAVPGWSTLLQRFRLRFRRLRQQHLSV